MNSNGRFATIPLWSLVARIALSHLIDLFFPTKLIDKHKGLREAVGEIKKGRGLVLVFTHFSLRDAMEINRCLIYKNKEINNRDSVNPLAFYQYNWFLKIIGKLFHGNFAPIVNDSTITRKGFEHLPKGQGLSEFVTKSAKMLGNGGIVTLAINATRAEKLDISDPQKPLGFFIAAIRARKIENFGILPVGFEIKNAQSYSKKVAGGMNVGKTYIIRTGKYKTVNDLLVMQGVDGKFGNIDTAVRKELTQLVSKKYL